MVSVVSVSKWHRYQYQFSIGIGIGIISISIGIVSIGIGIDIGISIGISIGSIGIISIISVGIGICINISIGLDSFLQLFYCLKLTGTERHAARQAGRQTGGRTHLCMGRRRPQKLMQDFKYTLLANIVLIEDFS